MPSRGAGARPGPPTLEEVAALAGLSRATVSRAVNGGLRVSPEAQQAVDDAVRRLGYTPNRAARSLVTRRTDSIAVVVPESSSMVFSDPFFAGTLHGVARALVPAELQMVLLIRQRDEDAERMVRYLRGGHTDGAVVVSHHRDDGVVEALAQMDIPRVFIGRPWESSDATPFVDVDNAGGARLAVERLVARGCRRIGTVTGPQDMSAGLDRLTGWREAVAAAGLPDDAVVESDFTLAGGRRGARELAGAVRRPRRAVRRVRPDGRRGGGRAGRRRAPGAGRRRRRRLRRLRDRAGGLAGPHAPWSTR